MTNTYETKDEIIEGLIARNGRGESMRYTIINAEENSLYRACIKHFKRYADAINASGLDYEKITQRRKWTKGKLAEEIKKLWVGGEDLSPKSVNRNNGAVYRQAYNLFGSWKEAVEDVLGIDYERVLLVNQWSKASIIKAIQTRAREGKSLAAGVMLEEDRALHCSAENHFGTYREAIEQSGFCYDDILSAGKESRSDKGTKVSEEDLLDFIRQRHGSGLPLNMSYISQNHHNLLKVSEYRHGGWRQSVEMCGIKYADITEDITLSSRAGHMFEVLVQDIFGSIGVNYTTESGCNWRPDFVINKDYWVDAKLSSWTPSIQEAIEKYEPHVKRLSIVYFRGGERENGIIPITDKTDMFSYTELLDYLPESKRGKYDSRIAEIEKMLA